MPHIQRKNDSRIEDPDYLKQQLLDSQEELQQFAYHVSHDLGAPLRSMVNFSRRLAEKYHYLLDEKGQRYLEFIVQGGELSQSMIADLLSYSRLETRAKEPLVIDCSRLLHSCLITFHPLIESLNAELQLGHLPHVKGDPDQLEQLLGILVDNALKFRSPSRQPKLKIGAVKQKNKWVFSIKDNGIGIDQRYHKEIFSPFKRLCSERDFEGTGMGLALARKIINRHHGVIWVESEPDKGAAFYFTLPVISE